MGDAGRWRSGRVPLVDTWINEAGERSRRLLLRGWSEGRDRSRESTSLLAAAPVRDGSGEAKATLAEAAAELGRRAEKRVAACSGVALRPGRTGAAALGPRWRDDRTVGPCHLIHDRAPHLSCLHCAHAPANWSLRHGDNAASVTLRLIALKPNAPVRHGDLFRTK